jgi:hypothetical protein
MLGFLKLPRIILHLGKNPAFEIAPYAQRRAASQYSPDLISERIISA